MKKIKLTIIFFLIIVNSFSQRDIETMYLTESGVSNKHVISENKMTYNSPSYEITVEIMNPPLLDDFFHAESIKNGKYDYVYLTSSAETFFEKRRIRQGNEENESYSDGLTVLLKNNLISEADYLILSKQITEHQLELTIVAASLVGFDISDQRPLVNPFYSKNQYLSVFKVAINNKSNSDIVVNKSDFSLYSGHQMFSPLSNDEIYKMYSIENELFDKKYKNLLKYNLPDNLKISGSKKIVKYFATIPLIDEDDEVNLVYKGNSFVWKNEIKRDSIDNTLKYFAFNLRPKIGHDNLLELHHFYIIKNTKGKTFINSEKNKLYTTLDAKFSIIAYTVYGNQLLFVETDLLTPSNFIDLEKKKREKIFIEYSRLEVD